jgi:hypothetical protein
MRVISFAIGLCAWLARPMLAQVGVTTDLIVGRVTSLEGHPIAGAAIRAVSIETRISRTATTNVDGRIRSYSRTAAVSTRSTRGPSGSHRGGS